jgi:hypothetical protein
LAVSTRAHPNSTLGLDENSAAYDSRDTPLWEDFSDTYLSVVSLAAHG